MTGLAPSLNTLLKSSPDRSPSDPVLDTCDSLFRSGVLAPNRCSFLKMFRRLVMDFLSLASMTKMVCHKLDIGCPQNGHREAWFFFLKEQTTKYSFSLKLTNCLSQSLYFLSLLRSGFEWIWRGRKSATKGVRLYREGLSTMFYWTLAREVDAICSLHYASLHKVKCLHIPSYFCVKVMSNKRAGSLR